MSFFSSLFSYSLIDLINNRNTDAALERIANKQELDSRTWSDHITPLHYAVSTEQQKIVVALVAAGAPINAKTYSDWITPLHQAAMSGNFEAARVLAPLADVNAKTYTEQNTALHIAVARGDQRVTEILLAAGASVALKNAAGETALHLAAILNDPTILRAILAKDPDVEVANNKGETPLVLTANNKESRKLLIEAGADLGKVFDRIKELQRQLDAKQEEINVLYNENVSLISQLYAARAQNSSNNTSYSELQQQLVAMTQDRDWWRTQTGLALEAAQDVPVTAIPVVEVVQAEIFDPFRPNPRY